VGTLMIVRYAAVCFITGDSAFVLCDWAALQPMYHR
jgi:hypothetical protein